MAVFTFEMEADMSKEKALLEKYQRQLVDFARRMIQTPSVTGQEEEMARLVKAEMALLDYDHIYMDELGNVVGIMGSSGPSMLFDAHMDTVAAHKEAGWTADPFGAEIRDGKIYGRGSADMKCALAALVYAGLMARELGYTRDKQMIITASVMEEDYDGEALDYLLRAADFKPELAVICEPSNLNIALGHRGRAMVCVESRGQSAHGSMPEEGVNAVYIMRKIIAAVEDLDQVLRKNPQGGSIALSRIESDGVSLNAVPSLARIYLDRRLSLEEDYKTIEAEMKELIGDLDARWYIHEDQALTWTGKRLDCQAFYKGWSIAKDSPALAEADLVYEGLFKKKPDHIFWGFSTNGVTTAGKQGIVTLGLGPGDPKMAHCVDEFCPLDDMFKAALFYTKLFSRLHHIKGKEDSI